VIRDSDPELSSRESPPASLTTSQPPAPRPSLLTPRPTTLATPLSSSSAPPPVFRRVSSVFNSLVFVALCTWIRSMDIWRVLHRVFQLARNLLSTRSFVNRRSSLITTYRVFSKSLEYELWINLTIVVFIISDGRDNHCRGRGSV
jgi:hypothetical protein